MIKIKKNLDILYITVSTILLILLFLELPNINPLDRNGYQIFIVAFTSIFIYLGYIVSLFIPVRNKNKVRVVEIAFSVTIICLVMFTTNTPDIGIDLPITDFLDLVPVVVCYLYLTMKTISLRYPLLKSPVPGD